MSDEVSVYGYSSGISFIYELNHNIGIDNASIPV